MQTIGSDGIVHSYTYSFVAKPISETYTIGDPPISSDITPELEEDGVSCLA